jgi:hypothetical protein
MYFAEQAECILITYSYILVHNPGILCRIKLIYEKDNYDIAAFADVR